MTKEVLSMNGYGYLTAAGYMGLVAGRWMLFASETEYYEYLEEDDHEDQHGNCG